LIDLQCDVYKYNNDGMGDVGVESLARVLVQCATLDHLDRSLRSRD
jgi:hypothetical protein